MSWIGEPCYPTICRLTVADLPMSCTKTIDTISKSTSYVKGYNYMPTNLVVAVTDYKWYEKIKSRPNLDEVNHWAPSAINFRALNPGELFLFKLKAPVNRIVGGGFFSHSSLLSCFQAWKQFEVANGADSYEEMLSGIARLGRIGDFDGNTLEIGCRILNQPFFFEEGNSLPVPPSFKTNIVRFKTYNTGTQEGSDLWEAVQHNK